MKMKQITKIVAVVLALAAIVSLSACGSKVTLKVLDTEYTTEDYAICIAKENTALLDQVNAALQSLIDDGTVQQVLDYYISGTGSLPAFQQNVATDAPVLSMATNAEFPPYEYYESETIVGIDAVIAGLIADQLGMKLEIESMEFDSIITAVSTGKNDMGVAGMTVTEDRLESVNFTVSYATGVQAIIVVEGSDFAKKLAGTDPDELWLIDADGNLLTDFTIGVQTNTTGDLYSSWYMEDNGYATVNRYNKGADAVSALVAGKIDCVIIDNEPAKAFVAAHNGD